MEEANDLQTDYKEMYKAQIDFLLKSNAIKKRQLAQLIKKIGETKEFIQQAVKNNSLLERRLKTRKSIIKNEIETTMSPINKGQNQTRNQTPEMNQRPPRPEGLKNSLDIPNIFSFRNSKESMRDEYKFVDGTDSPNRREDTIHSETSKQSGASSKQSLQQFLMRGNYSQLNVNSKKAPKAPKTEIVIPEPKIELKIN